MPLSREAAEGDVSLMAVEREVTGTLMPAARRRFIHEHIELARRRIVTMDNQGYDMARHVKVAEMRVTIEQERRRRAQREMWLWFGVAAMLLTWNVVGGLWWWPW